MLIRWQSTIVDKRGNVQPGAVLSIRRESDQAIVTVFKDGGGASPYPTGTVPADENGYAFFYAQAGLYRITSSQPSIDWRDVNLQAPNVSLGGTTYGTVADGLEATQDGQYFSVAPSSHGGGLFDLYLNSGGAASYIGSYPSVEAMNDAISKVSDLIGPSGEVNPIEFTGEDGFGLGVSVGFGTITTKSGVRLTSATIESGGNGLSLAGEDGFVYSEISPGRLDAGGAEMQEDPYGQGVVTAGEDSFVLDTVAPLLGLRLGSHVRTDVMQTLIYGQSLSRGVAAVPPISTTQPYNNVMISTGVLSRPGDQKYNPSEFAPLVEAESGDNEGESPASGLNNEFVRRVVAAGEVPSDWIMAAAATGQGSSNISSLSRRGFTRRFEQTLQLVAETARSCRLRGQTYSVWAHLWAQGEQDYNLASPDTLAGEYAEALVALYDDMNSSIAAITGQQFLPYVFTYQVAAHRRYNRDEMPIALAQWRISRDRPEFVLAVPAYILATGPDNLHLTNEASWLFGAYVARAMFRTMYLRSGKFRPLEPVSVDWTAAHIDVRFYVPCGPLVLDTALCAAAVNQGFDIRGADGSVVDIINGVAVTSYDTVRIALSAPAPAGAKLVYARGRPGDPAHSGPITGARGNLRDSQGDHDVVVSPLGNSFALHNACVMFEYDRASGF